MINLKRAVVYDEECLPNVFTLYAEELFSDECRMWEISEFRDDRVLLLQWFRYCQEHKIPMIGFNSLTYDYQLAHEIFSNPSITYRELYQISQQIISAGPFARNPIWENERFAPQIDLFKVHHFDNKAKVTSLKALQVNMRSQTVRESKLPFDRPLTFAEIEGELKPYNIHDVKETKRFAHFSMKALEFRVGLLKTLKGDVLNFNDTKIGEKILEQRLGEDLCYERKWISTDFNGGGYSKRVPRQTPRNRIPLAEIIFPYIQFQHPEFARVLDWMKAQTLMPEDIDDPEAPAKTKGVFTGVKARIGGIDFHFGTGGIHGSVTGQRFVADDHWLIRDIDVASLYPNVAIVNRLAPEHLGQAFVHEYSQLPIERKKYQELYGKKCVEANSFKLAANGAYGKSNSMFSCFYDPKLTMSITINGQLLLCMLAEWLLSVPTLQIIQINTDGITYRIHSSMEWKAAEICKQWQQYTLLVLEDANYSRMFIRDVNSYIAESKEDGKLKLKGAYWTPEADRYAESISEAQPPAWHKDLSNVVSTRAAVAAMVKGVDLETYIRAQSDPFDFMCRVKVDRGSRLMLGNVEVQRVTRYYVAVNGAPLVKISPPPTGCKIGDWKRRNGISESEYQSVLRTLAPGTWDARIHTKNKSVYQNREMAIEAGWKIAECNDASSFDFNNVDYRWYVAEAQKLII